MHKRIGTHFKKVDPKLFREFQKIGDIKSISPIRPQEYFRRLCREIISQQLSSKVADKFLERFILLFPRKQITPKRLLNFSDQKLRGIGISWAKVKYLKDLANKIEKKEISLHNLRDFNDQKIIEELTKVKGIGNWTAEMFLMFSLGREDVFSCGDLGLRKAIEKIYKVTNLTETKLKTISIRWSPYRTWACRILWASHDKK